MGTVWQVLLTGLGAGTAYALVAVGVTVVGGLVGSLPLAHGDLVGGAIGAALLVVLGSTPLGSDPSVPRAAGVVLLALVLGLAGGAVLHAVAVRPFLRERPGALPAGIAGLAVAVVLGALLRDGLARSLPRGEAAVGDPLLLDRLVPGAGGFLRLGGDAAVPARLPAAIVLGGLAAIGARMVLRRSRFGLAVRAVTNVPELAAACGVATRRTLLLASAGAGLLAAVAGLLAVPEQVLQPDTGVVLGLKALTAALLGGIGSVGGAVVAGVALGLAEATAAAVPAVGPAWTEAVLLVLLVVVALARRPGVRAEGSWVAPSR